MPTPSPNPGPVPNPNGPNDRLPNFRTGGRLYLVRCFVCPDAGKRGRENYAPSVPSGSCAWCGWTDGDTA